MNGILLCILSVLLISLHAAPSAPPIKPTTDAPTRRPSPEPTTARPTTARPTKGPTKEPTPAPTPEPTTEPCIDFGWQQVDPDGPVMSQISIASDGSVIGITSDHRLYRRVCASCSFEYLDVFYDIGTIVQVVAVAYDYLFYVVDDAGIVYSSGGDRNRLLQRQSVYISIASDGTMWGMTPSVTFRAVWEYDSYTWEYAPGYVWSTCAADSVDEDVTYMNMYAHVTRDTRIVQVGVGSETNVWAIDSEGRALVYNPSVFGWNEVNMRGTSGSLSQISVGNDGVVMALDDHDNIYVVDFEINEWKKVCGSVTQVSVGSHSEILAIGHDGEILRATADISSFIDGSSVVGTPPVEFNGPPKAQPRLFVIGSWKDVSIGAVGTAVFCACFVVIWLAMNRKRKVHHFKGVPQTEDESLMEMSN